ncbi:hexamerin-1.1-like [Toxorhynchites rutilus septentrionalis]|uniref:hexamerin-1.1-like n=1 Tax=Toxorhynchites rutilus septentrionalis TaxID=329112 RepID=UPI002479362C|nr:hexamerin-1.1-like [Toxorhynchites rutilus septentrionalis]
MLGVPLHKWIIKARLKLAAVLKMNSYASIVQDEGNNQNIIELPKIDNEWEVYYKSCCKSSGKACRSCARTGEIKMRLTLVAIALCLAFVPALCVPGKYADKQFLAKQKFFFEVFRNIHLPLTFEEYLPYTNSWVSDEAKYKNYQQVVQFFDYYKSGYLPKGEIYTVYNKEYMKQTYYLFTFLYNSNDWDTFYKNAIWARENVNEGMFIYALTMTVFQHPELKGIVLPAIYEIYPYYFYNTDMIHKAMYKKLYEPEFGYTSNSKYNAVYSNYTYEYPTEYYYGMEHYYEDKLNYFTEDIGLNAFYYYFMMDYPFFLGGDQYNLFKDRRGEQYLYMYQQLIARYYLERQANFMGPIDEINWDYPIKTGYCPKLTYYNGMPFYGRNDYYSVPKYTYHYVDVLKDYEMRIRQVIDQGYLYLKDGSKVDLRQPESIDYLGNLINGNPDSVDNEFYKYIGYFARIVYSGSDPSYVGSKVWPSALMHFETSMRDPFFYQLYNKILGYYWQFKSYLPYYTYDELNYKGLEIKNVMFDKLVTYFEYFDSDISNVIPMDVNNDKYWDMMVYARQKRINHKPFTYTMDVYSENAGKGVVRMYMGPKIYDVKQLQYYKKYFVEVDQYVYDFVAGKNTIVRNSRDFYWSVRDRTTYKDLYKKVMMAYKGDYKFQLDMSESHCGWPDRLLLPKGLPNGYELTFYFIVTPYQQPKVQQYSTYDHLYTCGVGSGSKYVDDLPFGYPFDRPINYGYFLTKNMYFKNALIYHFDDIQMNKTF